VETIDTIGFEVVKIGEPVTSSSPSSSSSASQIIRFVMEIDGMSCSSCSKSIEKLVSENQEIIEVNVNPTLGQVYM